MADTTAQETPTYTPPMTGDKIGECYTCEGQGQTLEPYGNETAPQSQGTLKRGL